MKNNPDILFVCAAGNSNLNLDENVLYPVCYDLCNVISVMSINNQGTIYEYSGYGKCVDIATPVKDIYVEIPEQDKTYVDGTSVSTAFVTGAFILMAIVTLVCRKKTVVISAGVLVMYIAIICQYIMFYSFYIANMCIIMALVVGFLLILYGIIAGLKTKK